MAVQMLCTDCFHVAVPDTVLEGSDLVEMLAWGALGVPGFVYCWWRHLTRMKVCPNCGSPDLIREAHAKALRGPPEAPPSGGPRIRSLSGPVRWPRALRAPRTRLWSVGVAALLLSLALIAWLLTSLDVTTPGRTLAVGHASSLLGLTWLVHQIIRLSRMRAAVSGCRAWDESGRPLRIEAI